MSSKHPLLPLSQLQQAIEAPGLVRDYYGSNGLEAYFSNLAEHILNGRVMLVDNLTTLDALSGQDVKLVLVRGVALYGFTSAAGSGSNPLNRPSTGGYWEYLIDAAPRHAEQIIGNNVATTFSFKHGLNTGTPVLIVMNTVNGFPYSPVDPADYTWTATDADTIEVVFNAAPPTRGYTLSAKK